MIVLQDLQQVAHAAWKVLKYRVFSAPYFPVFGLNTGKYGPEKALSLDTFLAVPETSKVSYLH